MADLDFYKVLDVSRGASADEIRKAYKKLASQNHPDRRPNDKRAAEKFKQVQEAYSVLGDAEKREMYDRYGTAFQGAGRGPNTQTWSTQTGPIDLGDLFGGQFNFGDLFGDSLGGGSGGRTRAGRRAARVRKGQDVQAQVEVPFQVAAEGGVHEIQIVRDGQSERLSVKIPAGVDTGSVIRLAGQGQPGFGGGPPGDVLVTINVATHPYFRREGAHLLLEVPITVTEAALGAKVEVPTLSEGNVVVTIPAGTSSGSKLRLRGKGVVDQKTKNRGDQFVVVKIVVPQDIDEQMRQLLQQLAESAAQSPREDLWTP